MLATLVSVKYGQRLEREKQKLQQDSQVESFLKVGHAGTLPAMKDLGRLRSYPFETAMLTTVRNDAGKQTGRQAEVDVWSEEYTVGRKKKKKETGSNVISGRLAGKLTGPTSLHLLSHP